MSKTILKSALGSPWALFLLLLASLYSAWSIAMIFSVNQRQQVVSNELKLIAQLNKLDQAMSELETWVRQNQQGTTDGSFEARWRQLSSNYRAQVDAFDWNHQSVHDIRASLMRLDSVITRMDRIRAPSPGSALGQAETKKLEAQFLRETNRALEEVDGTIQTARRHLTNHSLDLAANWGSLKVLAATSIIWAIFICGLLLTLKQVTERKRAEQALAAEKERLAVTLHSIGDGVITTDTEGKIVLVNKAAETLTGWAEQEALGNSLSEVYHVINEKTGRRCENAVERVLKTGRSVGLANHTILVAKDSTERIIADSGAPIHDKDGHTLGVVLVFRDITERRKLEQELLKTQKLESIGLLAGGIAHDFNNILAIILGNVSLAQVYVHPESEMFDILSEAEKACQRARELTQQLLTFSKGGVLMMEPTSITALIKDSVGFALRGSNVRCESSLPDDLWAVEVDEGQISRVIQNLMINAKQAMPGGGVIHVRAENVTVRAEQGLPLKDGNYVKIAVEDQGVGIPKEHLPKIFDPYFTTKQEGSGLGLATTYSIIKKHGGHIRVESTLGKGSTFTVYLPASEEEIALEKKTELKNLFGEGKILLMDDEEGIRKGVGRMLEQLGYKVHFAQDGVEAVKHYNRAKECGYPFDGVILDLTIPGGMGGKEAIKKLIEVDPHVRAIASSGYSNDAIMANFRQYGFRGFISKPYKIQELSQTLDQLIGEKNYLAMAGEIRVPSPTMPCRV
ncbi:MAG: PAS domain S-box protein [Acidobacteria bacterium]|nr:PAS domain S-box protein [Acidobacteriota bacterium]